MRINKRLRFQLQLQKIIFIALLLCAAGLVAWLSQQYSTQFDWTTHARNSLSKSSVDLLKALKHPVAVNVYVQDDPTLRQAVEEILKRYQRVKPDFEFRLVNPDIDIEQASQDEISAYGQVVIKYQGRKENIATLGEQSISSALLRLSRDTVRKVQFLGGHGERDPNNNDNRGYTTLAAQLGSKGFIVERINLLQDTIDAQTQILVIAAPSKALLDGERAHIEHYINAGGNLLWLADPGELAGLKPVAEQLGLEFQNGMVMDNNVNLRATLQIEHPAIIPVLEYYPHAVTKGIDYNTLFPIARGIAFKPDTNSDWEHNELFRSFEKSWTETGGLSEEVVFNSADGDIAGPITLGIALDRILPLTAVPGEDENVNADKASQRIVVVGDSDFLANAYIGSGANLALGMNIFNWLAGDDDLIAVELKAAPDTQLQLNDLHILFIGFGFFIVLPGVLLLAGFVIWFKRRKR
ncbi:MAG: Gldg family protein [Gammaproteobacteria bacterium]